MNVELLYTSAPQGLKQGSRGFCTVLSTVGLPLNLAQRLESMSNYRQVFPTGDPKAALNPICFSHVRFNVGGRMAEVLSRISAYGFDYSQRTNKLAHHLVVDSPFPLCGPAAILARPSAMRTEWDGVCETIALGPIIKDSVVEPKVCARWQNLAGDAGWGGTVANTWLQPSSKPLWIVFSETQSSEMLPLMEEAVALLDDKKRWQATFSTYWTNLPPDVECRVRCVLAGSEEARMAIARGTVIDLTKSVPKASMTPEAEAARIGRYIGADAPRPAAKATPIAIPNAAVSTKESLRKKPVFHTENDDDIEYELSPESSAFSSVAPSTFDRLDNYSQPFPSSLQPPEDASIGANWLIPALMGICGLLFVSLAISIFFLVKSNNVDQIITDSESTDSVEVKTPPNTTPEEIPPKEKPAVEPSNVPLENEPKMDAPPILNIAPVLTKLKFSEVSKSLTEGKDGTRIDVAGIDIELSGETPDQSKLKLSATGFEAREFFEITRHEDRFRVFWFGKVPPNIASTTLKISYGPFDQTDSVEINFKKKQQAQIEFTVGDKGGHIGSRFVDGELAIRVSNGDLINVSEYQWIWEISNDKGDQWIELKKTDELIYAVDTKTYGKKLRVRPVRKTPDTQLKAHDGVIVEMLPLLPVTVTVDQEYGKKLIEQIECEFNPVLPETRIAGVAFQYGAKKTDLKRETKIRMPLNRILSSQELDNFNPYFENVRNAMQMSSDIRKYAISHFSKNKGEIENLILEDIRKEAKKEGLVGQLDFLRELKSHDALITKILRWYELENKDQNMEKDLKKELHKLRDDFIVGEDGYPDNWKQRLSIADIRKNSLHAFCIDFLKQIGTWKVNLENAKKVANTLRDLEKLSFEAASLETVDALEASAGPGRRKSVLFTFHLRSKVKFEFLPETKTLLDGL